jgi:hypothetical protein
MDVFWNDPLLDHWMGHSRAQTIKQNS